MFHEGTEAEDGARLGRLSPLASEKPDEDKRKGKEGAEDESYEYVECADIDASGLEAFEDGRRDEGADRRGECGV